MPNSNDINASSHSDDEIRNRFFDLTTKAAVAQNSGEYHTAINLYLAAYEIAKNSSEEMLKNALVGVKKAWDLVLQLKDRPMAEHVFEIFTRHYKDAELQPYGDQLHDLMLDKLKNLGVPVEHLQDTESASDALDKMKNFIAGLSDDAIAPAKNEVPQAHSVGGNSVTGNSAPKNMPKPANPNNDYYIRRELNKYDNLVGFETAIAHVREKGIIGHKNSQHKQLVERLNKEHGLNRISFSDTLIFKSPSRVDANLFMEATASEIGMPAIQMHMDENPSGGSVLCMMAPADSNFRLNPSRTGFNGKGTLMLEDVDNWDFPDPNEMPEDGIAGFFNAQMSRGIAEVTNLIDIALDDPNIIVMATVGDKVDDDEIRKALGSDNFTVIRVDNPTDRERAQIWGKLAADHPSLRAFSTQKLVDYSRNMSRYDIEVAVHEALEDAYRMGIQKGEYIPLSIVNIVERLADHQPLDSTEYKKLEDVATADFKKELEHIDDILK